MITNVGRQCRVCETEQPLENFHWYTTRAGKRLQRHTCKSCTRNAVRKHRAENGPRAIDSNLKWKYNITKAQFDELAKNGCVVCGSMENLVVDHDHNCCDGKRSCGECIRGVLCNNCNAAEGMLEGSMERAMSLVAYLMSWEKRGVEQS